MRNVLFDDFNSILKSEINIDNFKDKSILITGATGLIGSLLVRFFLYANKKIKLNTRIIAVVRNKGKANKIFKHYSSEKLEYIVADLTKDEVNYDSKVDYIIHTAAVTKSKDLVNSPVEAIDLSVIGTKKLLNLAVEKKVKSFLYISSMEIYGQLVDHSGKVNEDCLGFIDLTNIRSCYPESKRLCEVLCVSYAHEYKLNVKIARLAQTFGAGVLPSENRVFIQFAKSVREGKSIVLHTEGNSEGNYVYSSDALKALLILLLRGKKSEAYNVSNEENHLTIKEMARMVQKEFGHSSKGVLVEIPKENMGYAPDTKLWLDNKKMRSLGWKPVIGMAESYKRLIEWIDYCNFY